MERRKYQQLDSNHERERERERERETPNKPFSFEEVCNLMNGTSFSLFAAELPPPLPLLCFLAGSAITVTSCPLGRPLVGGMVTSKQVYVRCCMHQRRSIILLESPLTKQYMYDVYPLEHLVLFQSVNFEPCQTPQYFDEVAQVHHNVVLLTICLPLLYNKKNETMLH